MIVPVKGSYERTVLVSFKILQFLNAQAGVADEAIPDDTRIIHYPKDDRIDFIINVTDKDFKDFKGQTK
jgi:hypothetical protein